MKKYTSEKGTLIKYTNFDNIEAIDNILSHINKNNTRYETLKHTLKQLNGKKNIMKKDILKKYILPTKIEKNKIKYKNFNNINKIRQILKNIDKSHKDYKSLESALEKLEVKKVARTKEKAKGNQRKLLKMALFAKW